MEVSRYGQQYIGRVYLYVHMLYVIQLIYSRLPLYGDTPIQLDAASNSCYTQSYRRLLIVHPG